MPTRAINCRKDNAGIQISLDDPDRCPVCHNGISAEYVQGFWNGQYEAELVYYCPKDRCRKIFIAYASLASGRLSARVVRLVPLSLTNPEFHAQVSVISPDFIEIYRQASAAEQGDLDKVSGPGYRKAFEFLVKDYLIGRVPKPNAEDEVAQLAHETEVSAIKKLQLGPCIEQRVDNSQIKEIAKRAAWLGNDQVHYLAKWEDKDVKDLKKTIDLTVHWMVHEHLTEQILKEMP